MIAIISVVVAIFFGVATLALMVVYAPAPIEQKVPPYVPKEPAPPEPVPTSTDDSPAEPSPPMEPEFVEPAIPKRTEPDDDDTVVPANEPAETMTVEPSSVSIDALEEQVEPPANVAVETHVPPPVDPPKLNEEVIVEASAERARPLYEPSLPDTPVTMRSYLNGRCVAFDLYIRPDGSATAVLRDDGGIVPLIVERAREDITRRWRPARNGRGEAVNDRFIVRFCWRDGDGNVDLSSR